MVGNPDVENPSSITVGQLQKWRDSGAVEWWGHKENMPEVLSQATVICLPSYYGEGVPKVLLEAMACARPIITTNTPGCRDLAGSGQSQSGLLVNASDVNDLVCAIKTLLAAPSHCKHLGLAGRQIVESQYGFSRIASETLAVYEELLTKTR